MKLLLDTAILVDFLRRYSPAEVYLKQIFAAGSKPYISIISAMELYLGPKTVRAQALAQRLVDSFNVVDLNAQIGKLGLDLIKRYSSQSGIDVPDCLIAATALEHDLELVTRNVKHFQQIGKLTIIAPY